jgi:hypothetical protein
VNHSRTPIPWRKVLGKRGILGKPETMRDVITLEWRTGEGAQSRVIDIGTIEDERDADRIVECVNALFAAARDAEDVLEDVAETSGLTHSTAEGVLEDLRKALNELRKVKSE